MAASRYVKKYGGFVRLLHLIHLVSFIGLAATGLSMAYKWNAFCKAIFGSMANAKGVHEFLGWVFVVTGVLFYLALLPHSIFKSYDFEWLIKLGGYLDPTHKTRPPAGKVNAGQKVYYWWCLLSFIVISITGFKIMYSMPGSGSVASLLAIHFVVAVLWVAFFILHFYLGVLANPGSLRQMVDGMVSVEYIKFHYPEWYRELKEKGAV